MKNRAFRARRACRLVDVGRYVVLFGRPAAS